MKLEQKLLPRDVRTRWNSTYDMLVVGIEYKEALKKFCADADHGLRDFEMSAAEWEIAAQIRDALKVCVLLFPLAAL